jgi:hypothetical protein
MFNREGSRAGGGAAGSAGRTAMGRTAVGRIAVGRIGWFACTYSSVGVPKLGEGRIGMTSLASAILATHCGHTIYEIMAIGKKNRQFFSC